MGREPLPSAGFQPPFLGDSPLWELEILMAVWLGFFQSATLKKNKAGKPERL